MSGNLIGKRFVILRSPTVVETMYGRTGIALEEIPGTDLLVLVLDDMFPKEMVRVKRLDVYEVMSYEEPSDTVREDPPVAVPGYVSVTVLGDSLVCRDPSEEIPPKRRLILLSSIESVTAQEDGSALIYQKETIPGMLRYIPPIHTAEDFDEISRRMRTAAAGEELVI